jgi:HSP20 family molecular chaperone IbpA
MERISAEVRDGVLYLTIPKLTDDEFSFQVQ